MINNGIVSLFTMIEVFNLMNAVTNRGEASFSLEQIVGWSSGCRLPGVHIAR